MSMNQRRELRYGRWLNHGITATLFALLGTYLLSSVFGDGEWLFWRDVGALASAGFYGALASPIVMVVYELLALVRRRGYDAGHAIGLAQKQVEATTEGSALALSAAWKLTVTDDERTLLSGVALDLGIDPADLQRGSARVEVVSPWDVIWRRFAEACALLRERLDVDERERELDRAIRHAAGTAVTDLNQRVARLDRLAERKRRAPAR